MKQANAAHGLFENIKAEIKADNEKSGVQPKAPRRPAPQSAVARPPEPNGARGSRISPDETASIDGAPTPTAGSSPLKPKPKPPAIRPSLMGCTAMPFSLVEAAGKARLKI